MDIGPESPPFIAEPIKDPFKRDRPREPAPAAPPPAPKEEPLPA